MLGGVCSNQALGGEDWRWLAGRVVMHVGSPDRAVADVAREVARAVKKAAPDALPEVSREGGGAIRFWRWLHTLQRRTCPSCAGRCPTVNVLARHVRSAAPAPVPVSSSVLIVLSLLVATSSTVTHRLPRHTGAGYLSGPARA